MFAKHVCPALLIDRFQGDPLFAVAQAHGNCESVPVIPRKGRIGSRHIRAGQEALPLKDFLADSRAYLPNLGTV